MRKVKAALIQMNLKGDPAADPIETIRDNMIAAHMPLIEEAARQGVQVLGLQEVFNAPYFPATIDDRWFESAEAVPDGPTTQAMCEAAKTHGMVIVSPVYERDRSGTLYNCAAVIDADGSYLGKFRKIHIPKIDGFDEKHYFAGGDLGYPVFDTAVGRVGVYICYDRHFPEGWRALALNGAELVFNPSATFRGVSDHIWNLEQVGAAIANGIFIGTNNRVGTEPSLGNPRVLRLQLLLQPARRDPGAGRRPGRRAGGGRARPRPDPRGPRHVAVLPRPPARDLPALRPAP